MKPRLRWCNRARTFHRADGEAFTTGDATFVGYEDLAKHIARNPKDFNPVDRRKARNILLNIHARRLVEKMDEELAV